MPSFRLPPIRSPSCRPPSDGDTTSWLRLLLSMCSRVWPSTRSRLAPLCALAAITRTRPPRPRTATGIAPACRCASATSATACELRRSRLTCGTASLTVWRVCCQALPDRGQRVCRRPAEHICRGDHQIDRSDGQHKLMRALSCRWRGTARADDERRRGDRRARHARMALSTALRAPL